MLTVQLMWTIKFRKVGNSLGATFPKEVVDRLRVKEGESVFLTENPGGYQMSAYDPEFAAALESFSKIRKRYRNAMRELMR